jgi:ABC-type glycerol-3-phosphate transport system substrate-binding protein
MKRNSMLSSSAHLSQRIFASKPVSFVRLYFAILLIGGAFLWSCYSIISTRVEESPPGTVTIRIAHWQFETGVREAIRQQAAEYQKLHPNVRIAQETIPEPVYPTWMTTNLLGQTAPDIVEVPFGKMPDEIILSFHNRYFLPLTPYVGRPNPYNKGDKDLENLPLRATFKDGMRMSYVKEMQEYMVMPLSLFGTRIFYNRDLLKKLTGLSEPPKEYRAFLATCEKIAAQSDASGQRYAPIANSKEHIWAWDGMMFNPLTYPLLRRIDFNRDAKVGLDEFFVGVKSGRIDFHHPALVARYQMMREVYNQSQPGYTGVALQDAVFLFAQQRAVFLSTGTWDARSLQSQAGKNFEIGICDFPRPTPDDQVYGKLLEGPVYEEPERGFPFAITRTSPHAEQALDFLLFLAAKKQNQELNQTMGWIPVIKGTQMDDFLKPFEPCLEGVYSALEPKLGSEVTNKYQQVYSLYQSNQISYEQFVEQFETFYKSRGLEDYKESRRDWRRALQDDEQRLASLRAAAMFGAPAEAPARWTRYRAVTQSRQVLPEVIHSQQFQLIEKGPEAGAVGPYEYSAEVMKKIRERVKK